MLAGLLAARNIMGAKFDLWDLNTDQDFQEEGVSVTDEELVGLEASQPMVPELTRTAAAGGNLGEGVGTIAAYPLRRARL